MKRKTYPSHAALRAAIDSGELKTLYVELRVTGNPEREPYTSIYYCPLVENDEQAIEDAIANLAAYAASAGWTLLPEHFSVFGIGAEPYAIVRGAPVMEMEYA